MNTCICIDRMLRISLLHICKELYNIYDVLHICKDLYVEETKIPATPRNQHTEHSTTEPEDSCNNQSPASNTRLNHSSAFCC